jgi:glycosyltransferase involved in cell wall biosynthesis
MTVRANKSDVILVSMPSLHFKRWLGSLPYDTHNFHWFDVLARNGLSDARLSSMAVDWRKTRLRGGDRIRRFSPKLFSALERLFRVMPVEVFEELVENIKPAAVHTFEMQNCSYPLLSVIEKSNFRWIYSCWGSDLYWYSKLDEEREKLRRAMRRVDVLHTDCHRDIELAKELGFRGKVAEVLPGGGGYKVESISRNFSASQPNPSILIKGYQHQFGRALTVLKSIKQLGNKLSGNKIIVLSPHPIVESFIKDELPQLHIEIRRHCDHSDVLRLMGESEIYIGNSISDGMPNTLLEAMLMGAFPIQSNPGGATGEVLVHGHNGLLISDPENVDEIAKLIAMAISDPKMRERAVAVNREIIHQRFEFEAVKRRIRRLYEAEESEVLCDRSVALS